VPANFLHGLTFYCSDFNFIRALAACSRETSEAMGNEEYWVGKHIFLNVPELARSDRTLLAAANLFRQALSISFDIPQLPLLHQIPPRAVVSWQCLPLHLPGRNVSGWVSGHPLFGAARFSLTLAPNTRSVFVGAKTHGSNRRSYVLLENPYTHACRVSLGITGATPVAGPTGPVLEAIAAANSPNEVVLKWDNQSIELMLNGRRLGGGCSLCSKEQAIEVHMWAVCPACRHWFCASHMQSMPLRSCDVCGRVNYKDFVGGSALAEVTGALAQCYKHAGELWQELQTGRAHGTGSKFRATVVGILQKHVHTLLEIPALLQLLPDPHERQVMSKRRWERVLYRARVILDFFQQHRHKMLFRYLHAEAEKLPLAKQSFLIELADPEDGSVLPDLWRSEAGTAAVTLQCYLVQEEKQGSKESHQVDEGPVRLSSIEEKRPALHVLGGASQALVDCPEVSERVAEDCNGGSTALRDSCPEIYAPCEQPKTIWVFQMPGIPSTRMQAQPGQIPIVRVGSDRNFWASGSEVLPVVNYGLDIASLLFMVVPPLPLCNAATPNPRYFLLRIGARPLSRAMVIRFKDTPTWSELWAFLARRAWFHPNENRFYGLEFGDVLLTEHDSLAWLPPQTLLQLVMFPNYSPSSQVQGRCYIRAARAGRLGSLHKAHCALVLHHVRVRSDESNQLAMAAIPMCIHPVLIRANLGVWYADGHEWLPFELLPGTATGHPIWSFARSCTAALTGAVFSAMDEAQSQASFDLPDYGEAPDEDIEVPRDLLLAPETNEAVLRDEAARQAPEQQLSQEPTCRDLSPHDVVGNDFNSEVLARARQRRRKEGAPTSIPEFKESFRQLRTIAQRSLRTVAPLQN
ncbi:unnamed protein product, partial [Symbiodinium natans]